MSICLICYIMFSAAGCTEHSLRKHDSQSTKSSIYIHHVHSQMTVHHSKVAGY